MKYLLALYLNCIFFLGFGQTNVKKRILVIPYDRFEFISDYPLTEIAAKNNINTTEVFDKFRLELNNSFSNFENENFKFIITDKEILNPIRRFIGRGDGKFAGRRYYASNLDRLTEKDFSKLMQYYQTDFIVFINWYHIKKRTYLSHGANRKRVAYASHFFDYDVYNLNKEKILGKGKVEAVCESPSENNLNYQLLRLNEIKEGYNYFITKILEAIDGSDLRKK